MRMFAAKLRGRHRRVALASALTLLSWSLAAKSTGAQVFSCNPPMANQIVCENSKTGNPPSQWDVTGYGDPTIQGFATDMSVNQGQTISFKIKTDARAYRIDIYRIGYYGGNGARLITTVQPSVALPQTQPACITNSTTGIFDCGNWAISASWVVPANATSGVYIARLVRTDTAGASHILFVVRSDISNSALLYQTSDATSQAYNYYGGSGSGAPGQGKSLYGCGGAIDYTCRAFKVSYNRPFDNRGLATNTDWFFDAEYPMVRWLEANGYDISYISELDTARSGSLLRSHKIYMSSGHDEYWSGDQRANVEAARGAGVNLAFFSANEIFWKTRYENSVDGTNTPYRTLVCYKQTLDNALTDPAGPAMWTGTWRDPSFSPPGDGGRPENALSGTTFRINGQRNDTPTVPAADGKMRFWRNTSVSTLASGTVATLAANTLGFEWDVDDDNSFRPAGLFGLSSTTVSVTNQYLLDYGATYGAGTATHRMTLYRHPSGALVFGSGTVRWSWGLDQNHDNGPAPAPDQRMQQATVNLLADMGAQPGTLQAGLVLTSASTDTTPPSSVITSLSTGSTVASGTSVTVNGTAADSDGMVGGVEISVNGGASWHPATGRQTWSYTFKPTAPATYTIQTRAVDDSANLETPSAGVNLTVTAASAPNYTATFDDLTGAPRTLSGEYPAGVIDWSFGAWNLAPPWQLFTTQSISFLYGAQTSANFAVLSRFRLIGLDAYNGGSGPSTVTLSCPGQADVVTGVGPSQVLTITTGWTDKCSPVTVSSTNGWWTNFDNLVVQYLGPAPVGPVISNVAAGSITASGATIAWSTNIASTSQVEYGTTSAYGSLTTLDTAMVTSHSQNLPGLSTGTLYHYRVRSRDAALNTTVSNDYTFTTATVPPVISNVGSGSITASGAGITWTTQVPANTQVEYGTTTAYGSSTTLDPSLVTSHSQSLTGLTGSTLYHYRVRSANSVGSAVSGDFTFTTATSTATPPVISNVVTSAVSSTNATITWTTDIAATTQVEYGTTTSYGTLSPLNSTPVTSHIITLTALAPGTRFHYRVRSTSSTGALAVSGDYGFSTVSTVTTTATFDDLTGAPRSLDGQYPTGIIDWGAGTWWLSPPWGGFATQSISYADGVTTGGTFTFLGAHRLVSIQVYNGGSTDSTVTIACPGRATISRIAPVGQLVTISTGWPNACSPVNLGSTNGWWTNFDNFVLDIP